MVTPSEAASVALGVVDGVWLLGTSAPRLTLAAAGPGPIPWALLLLAAAVLAWPRGAAAARVAARWPRVGGARRALPVLPGGRRASRGGDPAAGSAAPGEAVRTGGPSLVRPAGEPPDGGGLSSAVAALTSDRALPVVTGAAAAVPGWLVLGPGGAVAAVLVAGLVVRRRAAGRRRAERAATAAELADALSRIAEELASGAHPAAALGGCAADGPRARELLTRAAAASRLGDDVPRALRLAAGTRVEIAADVDRVAAAWELADRHGVPLADLLDRAGADLRWRARFAARVHAQLAGPRTTALVLTFLPAFGLGLGHLLDTDPLGVLRTGLLGQSLLLGGIAFALAGWAWSAHIIEGAISS